MTRSPAERPNIVVIQADQFRWDCLGLAGNRQVRTPHLDQLAADGVTYANAFCPLPICTPSRYSLLSGLFPHQHGAWNNRSTLPAGFDTFPSALRRDGYRTAAVGKMHFTPTYLDVGYERMELAEQDGPGRYDDDYHRELRAAGLTPVDDLIDQEKEFRGNAPAEYWETFGSAPSTLPEKWHSTTWIGDRALAVLDGWADGGNRGGGSGIGGRQNLLHASFVKPHHPFDPPEPWASMYNPDDLDLLPGWTDAVPDDDRPYQPSHFRNEDLTPETLRSSMAYYYALISQLDHQVGRMLNLLRERGLYENTLIVFTADHGEYLGFHHQLLKAGRWIYDPLMRVPLVVKYPGGQGSGRVSDELVSQTDLAPTLLAAASAEASAPLPGRDLAASPERSVVFADSRQGEAYMARTHTRKLVRAAADSQSALFDLEKDPHELHNRIDDPAYASDRAELDRALARWLFFDTRTPVHADRNAAQIDAPNVPSADPSRRAELHDFFASQIRT